MKIPASLYRQVVALRAAAATCMDAGAAMLEQADAILHRIDEINGEQAEAPEFPEVEGCTHPEDKREDTSTMGSAPSFFCKGCRRTSDELAALKDAEGNR